MLKYGWLLVVIGGLLGGCQSMSKEDIQALQARADKAMQLQAEQEVIVQENLDLTERLNALNEQIEMEKSRGDIKLTLQEQVLFEPSSYKLSAAGRDILKQLASALPELEAGNVIKIVGHTDNMPVSKKWVNQFVDNWDLSARRAASVARYLIWGCAVAPENITVMGRAHVEPVADNATKEGRAANRRIEIYIGEHASGEHSGDTTTD